MLLDQRDRRDRSVEQGGRDERDLLVCVFDRLIHQLIPPHRIQPRLLLRSV
jgi:hypothetical protein